MREYDGHRIIDPANRIIARTTDTDFFLVTDKTAPPEKKYRIRSRGDIDISISGSNPDTVINDLRQYCRNHARCLLTFYRHQANH